jgi:hypothetical protein
MSKSPWASTTTAPERGSDALQVLMGTAHQTLCTYCARSAPKKTARCAQEDMAGIRMYGSRGKLAGPQDAEGGIGGGRAVYESPVQTSAPARGSWTVLSSCARYGLYGLYETRSRSRTR